MPPIAEPPDPTTPPEVERMRCSWPLIGVVTMSMLTVSCAGPAGVRNKTIDQTLDSDVRNCVVGTRDFYVPHVSTVDFNAGETVNLFVRERSCGGNINKDQHDGPAVLLIQGRSAYAIPSYDLQFKDYSWMAFLAKRGFDVYAMISRATAVRQSRAS
jgi:hypothetical protein